MRKWTVVVAMVVGLLGVAVFAAVTITRPSPERTKTDALSEFRAEEQAIREGEAKKDEKLAAIDPSTSYHFCHLINLRDAANQDDSYSDEDIPRYISILENICVAADRFHWSRGDVNECCYSALPVMRHISQERGLAHP